jgi:hypothetical protein
MDSVVECLLSAKPGPLNKNGYPKTVAVEGW